MYKVVVQDGADAGKAFRVEERTSIGRLERCEITIKDPEISREHARFFLQGSTLFVADLNSANGTFLNGKPVTRNKVIAGDIITIGNKRNTI